jgi:general secretion pathway protein G
MRAFLKLAALVVLGLVLLFAVGTFLTGGKNPGTPKATVVKADFVAIGSALRSYKINAGHFPSTEQGLKALVERPTTPPLPEDWVQIFDKVRTDPWRRDYQYRLVGEAPHDRFELRSLGKDGIEGTKDDQSSLAP